jgi:glycosyltransferase involved in cell wall biosynthesis
MKRHNMQSIETAVSNNLPRLSVISVVYNGREELAKTMDSVLAQDYPNIEYIVIDGESTDGTRDVIKNYEDKLDVFICERDEGIYDAMNKGITRASGEFILFMNCSDVFASTNAVSSAMSFVQPGGGDQLLFGRWQRRFGKSLTQCRPLLEKGLFNHQAVIYSRHIHAWHGNYVNVKGLTTADYLFFATLFNSTTVSCRTIDTMLAIIDINGISAGLQTFSQKYAIDFICGRVSKVQLVMVLTAHPAYRWIKTLLRRAR